jgi:hypothetical protein
MGRKLKRKFDASAFEPEIHNLFLAGNGQVLLRRWLRLVFQVGFHFSFELHRERPAMTVTAFSSGNANPTFAHTVFLDIRLFRVIESDTDPAND